MNFDVMRRTLEPEKTQHIWNVMYFYQRLWLAVKYKNIHRKYVPEMFGENFYWWYIKCYQDQLVKPEEKGELSWQAARHIEELWVWLEDNAGPGDKERWRNRAEEMADPV